DGSLLPYRPDLQHVPAMAIGACQTWDFFDWLGELRDTRAMDRDTASTTSDMHAVHRPTGRLRQEQAGPGRRRSKVPSVEVRGATPWQRESRTQSVSTLLSA